MKIKEINEDARKQLVLALNYLNPNEQEKVREGLNAYSSAFKKARKLDGIVIRPIEPNDNEQLSLLIKSVLSEFGANKPRFAYMDEETDSMYEFYQKEGAAYYVALKDKRIIGGIGFGPLQDDHKDVCELRKMYLDKEVRGIGLGNELLRLTIEKAKSFYTTIYLETLSHMTQAISLYRKIGFEFLPKAMGNTGHYSCDT